LKIYTKCAYCGGHDFDIDEEIIVNFGDQVMKLGRLLICRNADVWFSYRLAVVSSRSTADLCLWSSLRSSASRYATCYSPPIRLESFYGRLQFIPRSIFLSNMDVKNDLRELLCG
jgi:hypothetical protein